MQNAALTHCVAAGVAASQNRLKCQLTEKYWYIPAWTVNPVVLETLTDDYAYAEINISSMANLVF